MDAEAQMLIVSPSDKNLNVRRTKSHVFSGFLMLARILLLSFSICASAQIFSRALSPAKNMKKTESRNQKRKRKTKMKSKKDWLVAIIGVAVALSAIVSIVYALMDNSVSQDAKTVIWVSLLIIAVVSHIVALVKVKRGTLTVYRGWKDFGLSCIWPIVAIFTIISTLVTVDLQAGAGRTTGWVVTGLFAIATVASLAWMLFGGFANNQGKIVNGIIALIARTTATLFFLTYVSKLLEVKDRLENGSLQDYVKAIVGFVLFGVWFKMLVVPLVKDNREDAIAE